MAGLFLSAILVILICLVPVAKSAPLDVDSAESATSIQAGDTMSADSAHVTEIDGATNGAAINGGGSKEHQRGFETQSGDRRELALLEPATMILLGLGLAGVAIIRRQSK